MPETSAARRYAEALIEVAEESSAIEAVLTDLQGFDQLLDSHEGILRSALCTPVFSREERTAVLGDLLPKLSLNKLTANFLHVLNHKGRLLIISDITRAYSRLADARAGRVAVRVTTADAMSDAIANEVRAALSKATGKEVVLEAEVDAALIGGMVVRVGGKVYDTSIRTRLQQVKRSLLEAQTPAAAK